METSAKLCETFDQEREDIREAVKVALDDEKAFALFSSRLNAGNYKLADEQLREILQANSTVHFGDIVANWPSIGSGAFGDKMRQRIRHYHGLGVAVAYWEAFRQRHGGIYKPDWMYPLPDNH